MGRQRRRGGAGGWQGGFQQLRLGTMVQLRWAQACPVSLHLLVNVVLALGGCGGGRLVVLRLACLPEHTIYLQHVHPLTQLMLELCQPLLGGDLLPRKALHLMLILFLLPLQGLDVPQRRPQHAQIRSLLVVHVGDVALQGLKTFLQMGPPVLLQFVVDFSGSDPSRPFLLFTGFGFFSRCQLQGPKRGRGWLLGSQLRLDSRVWCNGQDGRREGLQRLGAASGRNCGLRIRQEGSRGGHLWSGGQGDWLLNAESRGADQGWLTRCQGKRLGCGG